MNRLGVPEVSVSRPAFSQCGNITDLPSDEPGNNFVSLLGAESGNDSQAQENGERLLPRGEMDSMATEQSLFDVDSGGGDSEKKITTDDGHCLGDQVAGVQHRSVISETRQNLSGPDIFAEKMNPPVLLEGDHKSGETAQKAVKLQSEPISPVNHGSGTFNAKVFGVGRDFTGEELFEYQLEQPIIQHGELSVAGVGDRDPHLAASSRLVDLDTRMPVSEFRVREAENLRPAAGAGHLGCLTDRMERILAGQVIRLRELERSHMRVEWRADDRTVIALDLRMEGGEVLVEAVLEGADEVGIADEWERLRRKMDREGVHMAPLEHRRRERSYAEGESGGRSGESNGHGMPGKFSVSDETEAHQVEPFPGVTAGQDAESTWQTWG